MNHHRALLTEIAVVFSILVLAQGLVFLTSGSPIRIILAIILIAFLPGYALSTVVFPAQTSTEPRWEWERPTAASESAPAGLATAERLAVSFGLSLTLGPIIRLVLPALGLRFGPTIVLNALSLIVVIFLGLGVVRRLSIPEEARYVPNISAGVGTVRQRISSGSPLDMTLNVALAVAVIAAVSSLTFALTAPQDGSSYTSTYLLAEDNKGRSAATNWPTNFTRGDHEQLTLVIENHEHATVGYTVVLELHRINNNETVIKQQTLDRYRKQIEPGQQWRNRHEVTPTMIGSRLQLVYLVYKQKPPSNPMKANAYRHLSIGINVSSDNGSSSSKIS